MSARIRYKERHDKPGVFESVRTFINKKNGGIYKVRLDTNKMEYSILNVKRLTIVRSTKKDGKNPPKHLHTLKSQAKKALETMGIEFDMELRINREET